ncbi:MAG: hypothetical protein R3274_11580, partial [Desulfobacterales bacterium]|nr:hypothetical protein [Desulfobacterales bacterium]
AVVDAVLHEMPGMVRILPAGLPGLETESGLTGWAGESFQKNLQHTIRIWPHLNDTGGFYIALLEKTGGPSGKATEPSEVSHPDFQTTPGSTQQIWRDASRMFDILEARFGIDATAFSDLRLLNKSRRDIYGVAADHRPPQMAKCISGLPLFHMHFQYPKLTTSCAAAFGSGAVRNVIDLSPGQLKAYLARRVLPLAKDQTQACEGSGYVLVRYHKAVLGVGFYNRQQGAVASLFPKRMAVL